MPLELAHAQLLETGLFQPTCESFSRDAPEINVLPGYRPVPLPHVVCVRVLVVWGV